MAATGEQDETRAAASGPDFHTAIELIGRRWTGVILAELLAGPMRFSELRERIPRITDAMLSQRLKELEQAEVVERAVTVARPVEVRYALTAIGRRLEPVLDAVRAWSVDWAAHQAAKSTR
ncbi:helix-turn-helix transcriptional regulator [Frankia sp. CNm7]|uniref:Helix-turn-helix transcriptional regulator n=1 Tax=Frankia nepalensis TaxID=1836974 RepID=A0A937RUF8_9ACTN|nr:helix-turn-helix domain-containing protein [Frankia nepalensis]MBL7502651.1 helix-turn-helix transcriptional regulator [Frankia nepalensis]MBL7514877.1 helix-turn-helix transcriptional regulator [Frankia nepalensis]MBL7524624.1 helix-turn-helix transcriptional regulator [Frankia nepalensis]MBL7633023.1 helix-turn-helix transcriptional regulator [Frankia nepalensis]